MLDLGAYAGLASVFGSLYFVDAIFVAIAPMRVILRPRCRLTVSDIRGKWGVSGVTEQRSHDRPLPLILAGDRQTDAPVRSLAAPVDRRRTHGKTLPGGLPAM